jgi:hypothetical protein
MRKPLKATKSFKYAGRRLEPGDRFDAKRRDAKVLVGIGRAEYIEAKPDAPARKVPAAKSAAPAPPTPQPAASPAEPGDLMRLTNAELRNIAAREGVTLDGRETKAQLVEKITENRRGRGIYQRRDMRAED